MAAQDWMDKDFYKELGVEKSADDATIKKAYRKLARKYHPDQNAGDAKAEAKFKAISEAYSVLSDKEQRSEYDQIRAYAGGGARFMPGSGGGGMGGGYEDLFGGMFGGGGGGGARRGGSGSFAGMNLDDLFGFGGTSFDNQFNRYEDQLRGQSAGRTTLNRPGEDIQAEITLPFRTAIEGDTLELSVAGRNVKTRIPAGTKDGATLKLRGKGYASPGDGPNGDLLLTVHVGTHPVYTMSGRNLKINVPVTFAEAAAGATIDVPKLDGGSVKVKIPAGTPNGRTLRVKGAGVVGPKATGDLLVSVNVQVPKDMSEAAKEALAKFTEALGEQNVRANLATEAAK